MSGISKRLIDIVDDTTPAEIICDGDSWVFGCEIVDPKIVARHSADTHLGVYDFLPENDAYRIPVSYTHLTLPTNREV